MMDQQHGEQQPSNQNANKKLNRLFKKPPVSKKPPEVKQTLTSKYRMLKANPLLKWCMDGKSLDALPPSVTNLTSSIHKAAESSINSSVKQAIRSFADSSTSCKNILKTQETAPSAKDAQNNIQTKGTNDNKFTKPPSKPAFSNLKASSNSLKTTMVKSTINRKPNNLKRSHSTKTTGLLSQNSSNKPKKEIHENKQNVPKPSTTKVVRRSLSAQHFERKRKMLPDNHSGVNKSITKSFDDLRPRNEGQLMLLTTNISPITEESMSVSFKSPSAYERRSVVFKTPRTPNLSRRSLYQSFIEQPELVTKDLQLKLNDWLMRQGKSIGSFHHLKCFGLHHLKEIIAEENKENIEVLQDLRKGSYEDLQILDTQENNCDIQSNANEKIMGRNLDIIAKDALSDLHKLILEGYPREQCEAWLRVMRQKYKNVEQEAPYWECRAAIEEARGNIGSAVECYKAAIIQGAEVHSVDESLEQLLQKFSLLNINTNENEDKTSTRERARIVKDARNVFKSTIIQFAVQERTLKKQNTLENGNDKKFIVTPVRRSTRSRRSAAYTSTPGMKVCTTLQDLDPTVRESMDFHPNIALC